MAFIRALCGAVLLLVAAAAPSGAAAGWPGGPSSSFAGGRVLLAADGSPRGLVVPLSHRTGLARPRGLLRSGTLPIHGAVREGYFYAKLALGTPPRNFSVIIDTGSTITYVPCADCTHCGRHMDAAFDPSQSSTAQVLPCGHERCTCGSPPCACNQNKCFYQRMYAERSSSEGWLVLDRFAFPDGGPAVPVTFGCETRETGEIYRQEADGILGMGRNANAMHSQLAATGLVSRAFSLCFGFPSGGTMLLGDVPAPPGVTLSWTPLLPSSTPYYVVSLAALTLAGGALPLDKSVYAQGYGTVIDSGTTFSYLPTAAFRAFVAALEAALEGKGLVKGGGPDPAYPDICWRGGPERFEDAGSVFPTGSLDFVGGASLRLPPHRYLFAIGRGEYCLGLFDNGGSGTLIGGIAVRNALVTYDLASQQVGFGDADCPNLGAAVAAANAPPAPATAAGAAAAAAAAPSSPLAAGGASASPEAPQPAADSGGSGGGGAGRAAAEPADGGGSGAGPAVALPQQQQGAGQSASSSSSSSSSHPGQGGASGLGEGWSSADTSGSGGGSMRGPWLTLALGAAAATLVGGAAVAVLRSPALLGSGWRFQRLEGDGGGEGDLEAELTPLSQGGAPNSADEPRAAAPQGAGSRGGALAAVATSVL